MKTSSQHSSLKLVKRLLQSLVFLGVMGFIVFVFVSNNKSNIEINTNVENNNLAKSVSAGSFGKSVKKEYSLTQATSITQKTLPQLSSPSIQTLVATNTGHGVNQSLYRPNKRFLLDRMNKLGYVDVLISIGPTSKQALRAMDMNLRKQTIKKQQLQFKQYLSKQGLNLHDEVKIAREYSIFPLVLLSIKKDVFNVLENYPHLLGIKWDAISKPALSNSVRFMGGQFNTSNHKFGFTDSNYRGEGQRIVVMDTGVDKNHPFLQGKVIKEACFSADSLGFGIYDSLCSNDADQQIGSDSIECGENLGEGIICDHGTHVAGIAVGVSASSQDFSGIAADADIIAIQVFKKVLGANGPKTFESDRISAFQWLIDNKNSLGNIAAVNMSLGDGGEHSEWYCDFDNIFGEQDVIDNFRDSYPAAAVIVSSGNGNYRNGISNPACYSNTLSVGALNQNFTDLMKDKMVDGELYGTNISSDLDFLAPGEQIYSSVHKSDTPFRFESRSGTSMAAPHIAGAWAVLKSANPNATYNDILDALKGSGNSNIADNYNSNAIAVNLNNALKIINGIKADFTLPSVVVNSNANNIYYTFNEPVNIFGSINCINNCDGIDDLSKKYNITQLQYSITSIADGTEIELAFNNVFDISGNPLSNRIVNHTINKNNNPTAPTSINITASLSDNSNVEPGDPITVSGQVNYNTGNLVTTGQVYITYGGTTYTAEVSNGQFSRSISAPDSSGDILLSVNANGFSDTHNLPITISGDSPGNSGSNNYYANFHMIDVSSYAENSYGNTLPVYEWWPNHNGNGFYSTNDLTAAVSIRLDNPNIVNRIDIRYQFYWPNGSRYATINTSGSICDGVTTGEWDWYHTGWCGLYIAGYDMAENPGRYKVKIYFDEGNGFERKKTLYYTVGWDLTEHRMGKGISNHNLITPTNQFYQSDDYAYAWAKFINVSQAIDVRWKFYEPNGALYKEFDDQTNDPNSDGDNNDDGNDYYGYQKTLGRIGINGNSAQNKTGLWQVKYYIKNPVTDVYQEKYTDSFQILENPSIKPTISNVNLSKIQPQEGDTLNISASLSDNTYLNKVVLRWKFANHSEQSQTWGNLNKNSHSINHQITNNAPTGALQYWVEVHDNSGNIKTSSYSTQIVENDYIPNAFGFSQKLGVEPSTLTVSDPITISGINIPVSISAFGGEYKVNNESWSCSTPAIISSNTVCSIRFGHVVNNGDVVRVRHSSNNHYNASVYTVLTISGVSATFTSITKSQPIIPTHTLIVINNSNPYQPSNTIGVSPALDYPSSSVLTGANSYGYGGYASGTVVSIYASPTDGYQANSDDCVIQNHTCSTTMTQDSTILINFIGIDSTPDVFHLDNVTGVYPATWVYSNPITITGLTTNTYINIGNGQWRVNDGNWSSSWHSGIQNGDSVQVRHLSASGYGQSTSTILTIGGVSGAFISTTKDRLIQNNFSISDNQTLYFGSANFTQSATSILSTGQTTYTSSNTNVATVIINTGEVSIIGVGTTTITATNAGDDNYLPASDTYLLTVNKASQPSLSIGVDMTKTLSDGYFSQTATGVISTSTVTYTSSNIDVATVDYNGLVTLVSAGTTTITATNLGGSNYLSASDTYVLTVLPNDIYYDLIINQLGGSGAISYSPTPSYGDGYSQFYLEGTTVTLIADANVGYQFDYWSGCDNGVTVAGSCMVIMNPTQVITAHFSTTTIDYQKVFAVNNGLTPTITPTNTILIAPSTTTLGIYYQVSDDDNTLSGLGLRVHFNANYLSLLSSHPLGNGLISIDSTATLDSTDFDNNSNTTHYINVSWADVSGNWPNTSLATHLLDLVFLPLWSNTSIQTMIGFSHSSSAAGYGFQSQHSNIVLYDRAVIKHSMMQLSVTQTSADNTPIFATITMRDTNGYLTDSGSLTITSNGVSMTIGAMMPITKGIYHTTIQSDIAGISVLSMWLDSQLMTLETIIFTAVSHILNIQTSDTSATISLSDGSICYDSCDYEYLSGTTLSLSAISQATPQYIFYQWSGDCSGIDNPTTITITGDLSCIAHFDLDTDNDGIVNTIDIDDDNDGLPDVYENANGLNSLINDANGDLDGDVFSNIDEYHYNGNPNDDNVIPLYQEVYISDGSVTITAVTTTLGVYYRVSDNDNALSGLGIRTHFDNHMLSFVGISNTLTTGFISANQISQVDSSDFDSNTNTNRYIGISWASVGGNWPNQVLPVKLFDLYVVATNTMSLGSTTIIGFSYSSVASSYGFKGDATTLTFNNLNLDIDDNGNTDALTDGLLILRYLFGFREQTLIRDVVATNAKRKTSVEIEAYLALLVETGTLDIDDNSIADALTDGLLNLRYMFGFRGETLIRDVVANNAKRKTSAQIEAYIRTIILE